MEKYIPYEKLSKKEKRKLDSAKRGTWGEINPVTRKAQNSRGYNRKQTQDWKKELPDPVSFLLCLIDCHQGLFFIPGVAVQAHIRSRITIWTVSPSPLPNWVRMDFSMPRI